MTDNICWQQLKLKIVRYWTIPVIQFMFANLTSCVGIGLIAYPAYSKSVALTEAVEAHLLRLMRFVPQHILHTNIKEHA